MTDKAITVAVALLIIGGVFVILAGLLAFPWQGLLPWFLALSWAKKCLFLGTVSLVLALIAAMIALPSPGHSPPRPPYKP